MNEKKITAFMIFISIALCVSLTLSGITLFGQRSAAKKIEKFSGIDEDINSEDDIEIAGAYTIKSTLPVSDAYKSGDTSKLNDFEKETLDMAKKVLDEIITGDMTDYEKEKAVYEWMTSSMTANTGILTVIPTGDSESDNPHDVLKYHNAVCVGYATTFRLFMQMLGIECKVIHSSDRVHSWNLVKLDDEWYHTDCYMDASATNYRNFNMNDERCSADHEWTREYFPAATGQKYNYVMSVCQQIKSIYNIPKWLLKAIDNRESVISCTFKQEINEDNERAAQYMVERLTYQLDGDYSIMYDWMLNDKGQYVLCFYIDYLDDEPEIDVDDETAAKIDETIAKALGISMEEYEEKSEYDDGFDYIDPRNAKG